MNSINQLQPNVNPSPTLLGTFGGFRVWNATLTPSLRGVEVGDLVVTDREHPSRLTVAGLWGISGDSAAQTAVQMAYELHYTHEDFFSGNYGRW
ncbi:MAG: hypothetical protein M9918_13245 [Anaerolineae bacterium]|nr:hypothetical protein [Anaerolineae bacterium]